MVDSYYYNDLLISFLDKIKNEKKISIKQASDVFGVNVKELYNIRGHGKRIDKEYYLDFTSKFPDVEADESINTVEEPAPVYAKLSGALQRIIEQQDEEIERLKRDIERVALENEELKKKLE